MVFLGKKTYMKRSEAEETGSVVTPLTLPSPSAQLRILLYMLCAYRGQRLHEQQHYT
jgi:hypothetical protein